MILSRYTWDNGKKVLNMGSEEYGRMDIGIQVNFPMTFLMDLGLRKTEKIEKW